MKKFTKFTLVAALIATSMATAAHAQLGYGGGTYLQDANSFAGTLGSLPPGWSYAFSGTPTFKGVGNGSSTAGGAWAYGTLGENAFGALHTGTPGLITLSVSFVNNTGSTLTDLTIAFNYEQWRYANTSGWDLSGTGGLASVAIVDNADFTGSSTGVTGVPTETPIALTISGASIAPGATFGLSWVTTDPANSDNGIAVDDFKLTAVPEPSVYMLLGVGILICGQRFIRRKSA